MFCNWRQHSYPRGLQSRLQVAAGRWALGSICRTWCRVIPSDVATMTIPQRRDNSTSLLRRRRRRQDEIRQKETELPRHPRAESGPTPTSTEKGDESTNQETAGAGSCDGAIGVFASSRQHKLRGRSAELCEFRCIMADN